MFNEGLDVPSIDTVLFLRPTQSPTIFLQQLGRGLRKDRNKKYLTVLDFIGNYKKANLIPFLLSGIAYNNQTLRSTSILDFEYPDNCYIDFEFQLIDLFKYQAKNELNIKDKIFLEYDYVKNQLNHRPTRLDLFLKMDDNVYYAMKRNPKLNIFRNYINFLNEKREIDEDEKLLVNTIAHKFLNALETTNMNKSYKIPVLKAFYNNGNIKMAITDEDIYSNFKEFYSHKSNAVDMTRHKNTSNYKSWGKQQYVSLANKNPIHFLKQSNSEFFQDVEGYALGLNPELKQFINLTSFINHFKDIIDYRTTSYYKDRFEKGELIDK